MKAMRLFLAAAFLLSLPLGALAASHEHGDHGKMDHGKMDHGDHGKMDHDGMEMHGDMIMLGEQEVDGIEAMVHLKDVSAQMAKMKMDFTHHFMVMFVDTSSGEPVEEGTVAVKVTGPGGKTAKPVKLMGMQGHFGADIPLKAKGEYKLEIGSKLKDGRSRQFQFTYTVQ